jgi:choline monooxygenase
MFVAQTRLPHLLTPRQYFEPEFYEQEKRCVFAGAWHFVGSSGELAKPGDFVTINILGTPIQVRNFNGQIRALSNVCAHRHALICSIPSGNSPTMRCQYHGWEYQHDGKTGRIPEPKNFAPFDQAICLPTYPVELVGQLVFVNLSASPQPLQDYFGSDFYWLLADKFGPQWTMTLQWQPSYPVNWKIPIENSLEAYHVPAVHPKTFQQDPGDERSEHELLEHRTAFKTNLPFAPHSRLQSTLQSFENRIMRWLGHVPSNLYAQHHVFPHIMFSFTDALSLCHSVMPNGPTSSFGIIRQFARLPSSTAPHKRFFAKTWGQLGSAIAKKIMTEDLGMFPNIQAGLNVSPHPGMLGRCEERIHSFQKFVTQAITKSTA